MGSHFTSVSHFFYASSVFHICSIGFSSGIVSFLLESAFIISLLC